MGRPGAFSSAVCTEFWSRCKAGIALKACILPLCASAWLGSTATPAAAFSVTVKVDAAQDVGALPPVWRFFGADEPNYATSAQGESAAPL